MTAQRDCRNSVYLYAQSLDNSGKNPCLASREPGEYYELETGDPKRATLLRIIDSLSNDGWHWQPGAVSLDCRISLHGDCLVTMRPLTRDDSGRVAPVMLIFNIWDEQRHLAAPMLVDAGQLMKRELSADHLSDISRLKQVMSWPPLLIALHTLIFSRRASHD